MIDIIFKIIVTYVILVTFGIILIDLRPDRNIIYKRLTDEQNAMKNNVKFYFKIFALTPFSIIHSIKAIIRG